MDQSLEMAYNKPAKGQGSITGFIRRKEVAAQFNLIRHEKARMDIVYCIMNNQSAQNEYMNNYINRATYYFFN